MVNYCVGQGRDYRVTTKKMRSTEKSKSRIETDEETPSKETVARRRDRKLKDDITNMMVD